MAGESAIIYMDESGFEPRQIMVKQGAELVFKNRGKGARWPASNIHPTHGLYPEFDPKQSIAPGQGWRFVFEKPGEWRFHDHLDPSFIGLITVSGLAASSSAKVEAVKISDAYKNIAKDSADIFSNDAALKAYVKIYGPKQTILRLHELEGAFGDCHQTAHKAGHFAYEIFDESAFAACSSECHSGCYHGATEAYFREHGTGNLSKSLSTICPNELNAFFSHQCIHGVGHGLMAFTDYALFDALRSCELLASGRESCFSGVFMENIVGALAKDDPKVKLDAGHVSKFLSSDPHYPCNIVDEKHKSACYFLQTSRMVQIFGADFLKVAEECGRAPAVHQAVCFQSMGRDVSGNFRSDSRRVKRECYFAPEGENRTDCIRGAVQDMFWDKSGARQAVSFCQVLEKENEVKECLNVLFYRGQDILSTKADRDTFCALVSEKYHPVCLETLK